VDKKIIPVQKGGDKKEAEAEAATGTSGDDDELSELSEEDKKRVIEGRRQLEESQRYIKKYPR